MKSWAESLTPMSVIMHGPYLNYLLLSTSIIWVTKLKPPKHRYWIQGQLQPPIKDVRISESNLVMIMIHICTWSLVFSWTANWLQKYRAVLWCFSSQLSILKNNTSNGMICTYLMKTQFLMVRDLVANVNLPRCGIILDEHIKPKGVAHPSPTVLRDEVQHNTMTMSYKWDMHLSKCPQSVS